MKTKFAVSAAATLLAAMSQPAAAIEFGLIRPLQHGPIGDSPAYADIGEYEVEGAAGISRTYGSEDVSADPTEKVDAARFDTNLAVGGGWKVSKEFDLTAYIKSTLYDSYTEEQSNQDPKPKLDTGTYRQEGAIFGTFRSHPFVFGGGIGLVIYAPHTREYDNGPVSVSEEVGSAVMPTLRLFGGFSTKDIDATLGYRAFAQGSSTVTPTDQSGAKLTSFDVNQREPGEVYLDGRLKFKEAELGASLSYLMTAQASPDVDEYSAQFATVNGHQVRQVGEYNRDSDQYRIGVGGRFEPSKMLALLGGLTYKSAYYVDDQYASIEQENLGAFRVDLGTELTLHKFRGFFHAGYEIDSSASFTQSDDSRSAANQTKTMQPPLNNGDSVAVTAGHFDLTIGGGVVL